MTRTQKKLKEFFIKVNNNKLKNGMLWDPLLLEVLMIPLLFLRFEQTSKKLQEIEFEMKRIKDLNHICLKKQNQEYFLQIFCNLPEN